MNVINIVQILIKGSAVLTEFDDKRDDSRLETRGPSHTSSKSSRSSSSEDEMSDAQEQTCNRFYIKYL